MLHILKRHPIPIAARFEKAVALTYAFPPKVLASLLAPGLVLDTHGGFGFLAVTTVHTVELRPAFLPRIFGRNFFLTTYRLFTRFTTSSGSVLCGLQTLRSDTNNAWLVTWGNRMTRYGYRKADIEFEKRDERLHLLVTTPHSEADIELACDISNLPGQLPMQSPFMDLKTALEFVAPLPFIFDFEPETHSMVVVEGRRTGWQPQPCIVDVSRNTFLSTFQSAPVLAGAFYLENVQYRWSRGRRVLLEK